MPATLPPHLTKPFQRANMGKTVSGYSGIVPFHKPAIGEPLAPIGGQAPQTSTAMLGGRGLMR